MRSAIVRAATRRGWVWPISPSTPRPASRHSFGSCVLLPDPVSPATIDHLVVADRGDDLVAPCRDRQRLGIPQLVQRHHTNTITTVQPRSIGSASHGSIRVGSGGDVSQPGDDGLRPRPDDERHRRHDGQRRPADAGTRLQRADDRHRVDRDRLPVELRRGHPGRRLARRPLRHQADVHRRADDLRRHVAALRVGTVARSTRVLPHPAGRRRRARHPGRVDDVVPGVPDGRAGQGGDRRAQRDGDRAGDRPDARRAARRPGVVALDLPDQRAGGHRHGGPGDRLAGGDAARGSRPARPRRTRVVGGGRVDPALHAVDRAGEGLDLADDARVRIWRRGLHRRPHRGRTAGQPTDPRVPPAARPICSARSTSPRR